jgi:hypothetical protein
MEETHMELKKVWKRVMLGAAVAVLAVALGVGVSLAAPTYTISGAVHSTDTSLWLQSAVTAELYTWAYDDATSMYKWLPSGTTAPVALSNGAYTFEGLANAGTYRVGFTDANGKLGTGFYKADAALAPATADLGTSVSINETNVVGIDATLSAYVAPPVPVVPGFKGTVTWTGSNPDTSSVSAIAYGYRWTIKDKAWTLAWVPVASSLVASDGTYVLDGLSINTTDAISTYDEGTGLSTTRTIDTAGGLTSTNGNEAAYNKYKVVFIDNNNIYAQNPLGDAGIASETATAVVDGGVVTYNATLVPSTASKKLSGKVTATGASMVLGDIVATVYQYGFVDTNARDSSTYSWVPVNNSIVATDGTWKLYVSAPGTYTVGFSDNEGLFGDVFYGSTSNEASTATLVDATAGDVANINVSMMIPNATHIGQLTDAVGTSLQVSANTTDGANGTLVLCSADSWTYAVSAAPYAKAINSPMLLIHKNGIDDNVMAEIDRLSPNEVVIVGGPSVIGFYAEEQLRASGIPVVRRLEGTDAYGTSAAIAQEMLARGLCQMSDDGKLAGVIFVSSVSPYEAMCAEPIATAQSMPILLVRKSSVSDPVQNVIDSFESTQTQVIVIGGEGQVSAGIEPLLSPMSPDDAEGWASVFTRVATGDAKYERHTMSVAVAQYAVDSFGFSARHFALATDSNVMDVMVTAPTMADDRTALLLTAPALKKVAVKGTSRPTLYTQLSPAVEEYLTKMVASVDPDTGDVLYKIDPNAAYVHNPNVALVDTYGHVLQSVVDKTNALLIP